MAILKYNRQHHFEAFLAAYGMRMMCRHHDTFAFPQLVVFSVDRDKPYPVKTCHKSIAAGFMRAYLLILVKREKRDAHGAFLHESFAYYLTVTVRKLVFHLLGI